MAYLFKSMILVCVYLRLKQLLNNIGRKQAVLFLNSANMIGSARQYYEKAKSIIASLNYRDEYINTKAVEIEEVLKQISTELKATNATDRQKKQEQEKDDLDVLFAPKKKWQPGFIAELTNKKTAIKAVFY